MHNAGYLREEPGAGKPHARICEGKSRMAELLDPDPVAYEASFSTYRTERCVADGQLFC